MEAVPYAWWYFLPFSEAITALVFLLWDEGKRFACSNRQSIDSPGHRVDFCFVLSCLIISTLWLLFLTVAENRDAFFMELSYANFTAAILKPTAHLKQPFYSLSHFAHVLTTLNSFASMDFLAALLLPFSRSSLGMLNSPDWGAALESSPPEKTGLLFSCSLFYLFSRLLIQAKISFPSSLVCLQGLSRPLSKAFCESILWKSNG